VWFGEFPYRMGWDRGRSRRLRPVRLDRHQRQRLSGCGLRRGAPSAGAHCVEFNLEPSEGRNLFAEAIHGRATEIVPAFVEQLLGSL
jgi:NAD-dependent deacetylase